MKGLSALILLATALAATARGDNAVISFSVPQDTRVSLALYDKDGRMVRTLLTGKPLTQGQRTVSAQEQPDKESSK